MRDWAKLNPTAAKAKAQLSFAVKTLRNAANNHVTYLTCKIKLKILDANYMQ